VIAAEKPIPSVLVDETSFTKVEKLADHVGACGGASRAAGTGR
jgi:electron transfer flavoprotein alpha subunit